MNSLSTEAPPAARGVLNTDVTPILSVRHLTKRFGAFAAVDDVSLQLMPGEIHGLLGENGAGKSTLTACISGYHRPDAGDVEFDGRAVRIHSPADATRLGIGMVHQHFVLVPVLSVIENIIAGTQREHWLLRPARVRARVQALCEQYGLDVDLDARVGDLAVGQQQWVEILKCLYQRVRLLILDEPTAVLAPQESVRLFEILRALSRQGTALIVITHKLDEALQCDNVTVMRKSRTVATLPTQGRDKNELSRLMVGRVTATPQRRGASGTDERLSVRGLSAAGSGRRLRDIYLSVRRGEIVGIAGVSGNGQRELFEVLAGARRAESGQIHCDGQDVTNIGPAGVMRAGVGHIPQDRFAEGLVGEFSVADNLALGLQRTATMSRHGFLSRTRMQAFAQSAIRDYGIATRSAMTPVQTLSGGNAQKVVIARELFHAKGVLLANQPTRGLDIGVIEDIYTLLLAKRQEGFAILLASDELDDLFALSDRIAVMYGGRLIMAGASSEVSVEQIGHLMAGGGAFQEPG
jgi:simple sugar transport system ATP-binding protein